MIRAKYVEDTLGKYIMHELAKIKMFTLSVFITVSIFTGEKQISTRRKFAEFEIFFYDFPKKHVAIVEGPFILGVISLGFHRNSGLMFDYSKWFRIYFHFNLGAGYGIPNHSETIFPLNRQISGMLSGIPVEKKFRKNLGPASSLQLKCQTWKTEIISKNGNYKLLPKKKDFVVFRSGSILLISMVSASYIHGETRNSQKDICIFWIYHCWVPTRVSSGNKFLHKNVELRAKVCGIRKQICAFRARVCFRWKP